MTKYLALRNKYQKKKYVCRDLRLNGGVVTPQTPPRGYATEFIVVFVYAIMQNW